MNKLETFKNVFNEQEQLEIFKELIQIPSENPGDYEEKVAKKIQAILEDEGIPSRLVFADERRPNVYATLEGEVTGKTLLYNGHIDTVPAGRGWKYPQIGRAHV